MSELLGLVRAGDASILPTGAFALRTGDLYMPHGRRTPHGVSGYTNHMCRCVICSSAMATINAANRAKRREQRRAFWASLGLA